MKRLGAVAIFMMLFALACGDTNTPNTPIPSALEATVQALAAGTESTAIPGVDPASDIEATITYRVQATVQALFNATPIPSPTPTQGVPRITPTPEPTSFTIQTGGSFNTAPAPTPTRVASATATPVTTPGATRSPDCDPAADGVRVSAWVNGVIVDTAIVKDGKYSLLVEQTAGANFFGQTVTFTVGSSDARQTIIWKQGAATELVLTAPTAGLSEFSPSHIYGSSLTGGPLAQPLLPHIILGNVLVGIC
ncbi:MAG: hypothetical protein H8E48_14655 [Chloroflexi bacterium]|nr:hypothetical protein [Chloroflexota bacterium]